MQSPELNLVKNGTAVHDDWILVREWSEETPLPAGDCILPLAAWRQLRHTQSAETSQHAVWLAPDADPAELVDELARLPLIAIDFPQFIDGRGYSIARLLRERYNYQGELRAIGDIGQDQAHYLTQVGFDALMPADSSKISGIVQGITDFSDGYQASCLRQEPYFRRRASLQKSL